MSNTLNPTTLNKWFCNGINPSSCILSTFYYARLFIRGERDMETDVKLTLAFIQHKAQFFPKIKKEEKNVRADNCSVIDIILEGPSK